EHLRPEPGQGVVERWRRLAEADRVHRVPEAVAENATGGHDLVVVGALQADRGEAQARGEDGEAGDDPEGARARPAPNPRLTPNTRQGLAGPALPPPPSR